MKSKVKLTRRKIACQVTRVFINNWYRWIYRCRTGRSYLAHASIMRTELSIPYVLGVASTKSIDWLYCLRLVYLYKLRQIHTMHTTSKYTQPQRVDSTPAVVLLLLINTQSERDFDEVYRIASECGRKYERIYPPPGSFTCV